ncbi:hypothetical protein EBI00_02875 [Marinomonas hwangdonensis]|uniref:Uncharacterized protein n=1 Tax=Marinomonas hwangdonensis TaxID=1053647 RepID=A0A3M8QAJ1_9GAMM|nr:hypothetical protein [Marinomonas hwangdonensis]RNF53059.1 hypothetical protein EBI00_02875 [Marinomonas hwangdonensis]
MPHSTIKYSVLALGCTFINLVHGNDLIAFGKECLLQEERLQTAKNRLDALSLQSELIQRKNGPSENYLERYQTEQADLEINMTECAETTPNSAYCHQIRRRYNELTYLIQQVKTEGMTDEYNLNDATMNYEITRANFNQRYDDFLTSCRNSDAHYALIQSPIAYKEVCSSPVTKKTVTCSLF